MVSGLVDLHQVVILVLGILGFCYTLWAVGNAIGDRRVLKDSGLDGERLIVANTAIREAIIVFAIMVIILALDGVALILPPITPTHPDPGLPTIWLIMHRVGVPALILLLIGEQVLARRDRLILIDRLAQREAAKRFHSSAEGASLGERGAGNGEA